MHTNPAFWRENAQKLNQNDHEVLRMIRILLKDEQDPTTLAVCAHDVGEYVRHYPVVSTYMFLVFTARKFTFFGGLTRMTYNID